MYLCKLSTMSGFNNVKFSTYIPYVEVFINRFPIISIYNLSTLSYVQWYESDFQPKIDYHWSNIISMNASHNVSYDNFKNYQYVFNNTHGLLSGNSFLGDITNPLPTNIELTYKGLHIDSIVTTNDAFVFKYLDVTKTYDITATPVSGKYNGKVIKVSPAIDKTLYRFKVFANYDRVVSKKYALTVQVVDYLGNLFFNLDSAPSNITINQEGLITVDYVVGVYDFTVNVSDDLLAITKQLNIKIEVI